MSDDRYCNDCRGKVAREVKALVETQRATTDQAVRDEAARSERTIRWLREEIARLNEEAEAVRENLTGLCTVKVELEQRAIDAESARARVEKELADLKQWMPRTPWDVRAADTLADEVDALILRKVIDMRSPAADALLDYRNPPTTPRSDRLARAEALASVAENAAAWMTLEKLFPELAKDIEQAVRRFRALPDVTEPP